MEWRRGPAAALRAASRRISSSIASTQTTIPTPATRQPTLLVCGPRSRVCWQRNGPGPCDSTACTCTVLVPIKHRARDVRCGRCALLTGAGVEILQIFPIRLQSTMKQSVHLCVFLLLLSLLQSIWSYILLVFIEPPANT
ncbi:hypothetical protein DENSPDRAFT_688725 [Dentipellis sp. KUC8613]|nr:hypothetical protein DENSPDRAFT_688725 [Dentipellis sp. KUC8613]